MAIPVRNWIDIMAMARSLPELKSMPHDDFVLWLGDNQKIYWAFRRFSIEALSKNRARFSAYMIRERVRWYTNIEYGGEFKISNNVTPYIARLLIKDIPDLRPIFSLKDVEIYSGGVAA